MDHLMDKISILPDVLQWSAAKEEFKQFPKGFHLATPKKIQKPRSPHGNGVLRRRGEKPIQAARQLHDSHQGLFLSVERCTMYRWRRLGAMTSLALLLSPWSCLAGLRDRPRQVLPTACGGALELLS